MGQCPHGELDKQKLFDMYCLLLPPGIAKIFVDQLFTLFDEDKSGSIDFKVGFRQYNGLSGFITYSSQEFLVASNMPTSGSAREKLRWIFEMYDEDRSGQHEYIHGRFPILGVGCRSDRYVRDVGDPVNPARDGRSSNRQDPNHGYVNVR